VAGEQTQRWRRYWDKQARNYDRQMGVWDRRLFRDSRSWICGQATGQILEVGVGTGLNLPFYPPDSQLIGIDASPAMLAVARQRAVDLGAKVDLREGDAQRLDFPDGSFDTVVGTFVLCAIPDDRAALMQMWRVLKPGGRLLLADHVAGTSRLARGLQRIVETVSVPMAGEHWRRRPAEMLTETGYLIEQRERFGPAGIVERLTARRAELPSA